MPKLNETLTVNVDLNIEAVRKAVKEMEDLVRELPHAPHPYMPQTLFGMPVFVSEPRYEPKLKLRADVPVSDEFRREFDSWLLTTFGTRDVSIVSRDHILMLGNSFLMRPETLLKINAAALP